MQFTCRAGLLIGAVLVCGPWLPGVVDGRAGWRAFGASARADERPATMAADPDGLVVSVGVFQVEQFSNLAYAEGFSGTVGATNVWPGEMGWQGDRIDIRFTAPATGPADTVGYRFRIQVTNRYVQKFEVSIQAGPSLARLETVHTERVSGPRQLVAEIPVGRFTPGKANWIRIQGTGVQVGTGRPSGIKWERWTLSAIRSATRDEVRRDQLSRFAQFAFDAVQPGGLVRDALPFSPSDKAAHPATPDAAGFAILALCAADHLGLRTDGAAVVERILRAYAGQAPGVHPDRSADGHWTHFMNVADGAYAGKPWEQVYTPIGSALLVSGAQFAKSHFAGHTAIAKLADDLTASTNFNAAIHPSLDGRVYLGMAGGGGGDEKIGCVVPWNEFMLVVSLARREADNQRARAVARLWLDPAAAPKIKYEGYALLNDHAGAYAPAFWVQQAHFFNADFATNDGFESRFADARRADALYCAKVLGQAYRYGLTAGVSPSGYTVDAIQAHHAVFSPEAVMAWGDLATFLKFYREQAPDDPRGRYGLRRVSGTDAAWSPGDAGLVDHLFGMFGLVESIEPRFFKARLGG